MFRRGVQRPAARSAAAESGSRVQFRNSGNGSGGPPGNVESSDFGSSDRWSSAADEGPYSEPQDDGFQGQDLRDLDEMASQADYFAALSRAVAALERDSYAARGAIYDREQKALMRRLYSADPPISDDQIEEEQQAFREAVRRIEFGEDGNPPQLMLLPPRPQQATLTVVPSAPPPAPPAPPPPAPPPPPRAEREWSAEVIPAPRHRPLRDPPPWARKSSVPSAQIESALEAALNGSQGAAPGDQLVNEQPAPKRRRRSIAGRVISRTLLAVLLLGVGLVGYDLLTGELELPGISKLTGGRGLLLSRDPVPQQAILFDGARPDLNGSKFDGKATWRYRTERDVQGQPMPVVHLDLNVPGRKVTLAMSLRPEAAESSMSHLFELRFLREDGEPDGDIASIAGVVMTTADMTRPTMLTGRVVNVTPGVFLFGLSAQEADVTRNLQTLKEMPWFGIPLNYRNGTAGVLTFAKGSDGELVITEAMRRWSRR
jgi:hypothetical protein